MIEFNRETDRQLNLSARRVRALNHPLRQTIIKSIRANPKATVTDLYTSLKLEQSVASQHLAILRKEGIVKPVRDGKFIFYEVEEAQISFILDNLTTMNKV